MSQYVGDFLCRQLQILWYARNIDYHSGVPMKEIEAVSRLGVIFVHVKHKTVNAAKIFR